MNKFRLFIFSTISIGILFSIFTLTLLNPNEKLIEVSSFPSFEMKELTEDIINQDAFIEGEYKLINVWATWCVNCKLEHGFLMNLKNKGIKIFGLNYKDDKENAKLFLKELDNPYKIIIADSDGLIAIEWAAYGVPESFLIYNNKVIAVKTYSSAFNTEALIQKPLISAIISDTSVE